MRLFRPHIPLWVRCTVAARQCGFIDTGYLLNLHHGHLGELLPKMLAELAEKFGCTLEDLRLDHDPALATRPRRRRGLGKKTYYTPDANDPDHLVYRPHGPEFEGSHHIKTQVRGDHGQFPDRVLIKRERKRREKKKTERKAKIAARKNPWPKGRKLQSRGFRK